jgi:hypothetical protein
MWISRDTAAAVATLCSKSAFEDLLIVDVEGDLQADQSKGEESLVDFANHDTFIFDPVDLVAGIGECMPAPVCQHGVAEDPEAKIEEVQCKVDSRIEASKAVSDECGGKNDDGQEGSDRQLELISGSPSGAAFGENSRR